jgi:hypothetical protein
MSELAERCRIALMLVVHTNKGQDSEPLLRIGGSIGFSGAARSVILFAQDPNDDGRRIMATVKSNLAAFSPPLAYRIVPVTLRGNIETSKVDWLGEAPEVDVGGLLARQNPQDRLAVDEAVDYLQGQGVLEAAQQARQLYEEAEAEGIDRKALQRARRRLSAPVWRDGFNGPWMWGPKCDDHSGQHHLVQNVQNGDDLRKHPSEDPILDGLSGIGEHATSSTTWPRPHLHEPCPECGRRWFHGHAEDCPSRGKP